MDFIARKLYLDKLVNANSITEEMKLIEGSKTDYITPSGKIYKDYGNNMFFPKKIFQNKHNGYMYTTITYPDGNKSRRHHILLAKAYIPNPNNLPVVGHWDNDKSNNTINNLYWTTIKDNTQKAVNDGLMINDKGYEDSQSFPVIMFDSLTGKEIEKYGSCREAAKLSGYKLPHILYQAKNKPPVRNNVFFRYQNDPDICPPKIVIQYNYETDEEIKRFYNVSEAQKQTGISDSTIATQCNNGYKPKYKTKTNTYFLYSESA